MIGPGPLRPHSDGGMAERSNAAVLKTVGRETRRFESYSLRHALVRGEVAERLKAVDC